jgi:hypothetical protein
MDANKLDKLRAINYQIHPTCGSCVAGSFRVNSEFGLCTVHGYEHQKHSQSDRSLSVHVHGSCESWVGSGPAGGWEEFMQEPRRATPESDA